MEIRRTDSGDDKKEIRIAVEGENSSFASALRGSLASDGSVVVGAAKVTHPLAQRVDILAKVSKGSAKDAVAAAAEKIGKQAKEFGKKFSEEYK